MRLSIRNQLLQLIISIVTLASFLAAIHGYRNSMESLNQLFDQALTQRAQFILRFAQAGNIDIQSTDIKALNFDSSQPFYIYVDQAKVLSSDNAPELNFTMRDGFNEIAAAGKIWRTFQLNVNDISIITAQPIEERIASTESIVLVTIVPIVLAIPIVALLIFYVVKSQLRPLLSLSRQLKEKSVHDLSPLELSQLPEELLPVVERIDELFSRLDKAFEREKQLTANTAHELRTPVSVLKLAAYNMLEDFKSGELQQESIVRLSENIERMAHVIEQIMALYRFSPENFTDTYEAVDLESILQQVVSNNYDAIHNQKQEIELVSTAVKFVGNQFALYTLFENLVRNAIKYSGQGASIKVTLEKVTSSIFNSQNGTESSGSGLDDSRDSTFFRPSLQVTIEDSGPGIAEKDRDKIFERFYRTEEQKERIKGTGLGLSIVQHIAQLHNGRVFYQPSSMGGAAFVVQFAAKDNFSAEDKFSAKGNFFVKDTSEERT